MSVKAAHGLRSILELVRSFAVRFSRILRQLHKSCLSRPCSASSHSGLLLLAVGAVSLTNAGAAVSELNPPGRPNIVLILADDLGYGDLSCQNPDSRIRTPRLDRLASEGARFTDAHAPSALCTPSRYSLLTGQHCWRTRLKSGVLNMWDEPLIAPERLTVARLLQNNGYQTACFGKWHLGLSWPFAATVPAGFDPTVTGSHIDWTRPIRGGPADYGFNYYFGVNIANEPPYAFIENDHVVGTPTVQYTTVSGQQGHWAGPGVAGWDWAQTLPQITTNTVRWIQAAAVSNAQPFFLFASLVGPHQPVLPSPQFQGTSQAGAYGDYVQELDWAVGRLLDALEATGAATNTLVIFTSDNGPDEFAYQRLQQYQHASMGPLRGIKSDVWEGGHRIPFLARWPGKVSPGTTNSQTISLIDFMRTAADIIGAQLPSNAAEDSVSFLPELLGNASSSSSNRLFVLESGIGQFGIRSNNWMYIDSDTGDGHNPELEPVWFQSARKIAATTGAPVLLYDLNNDLAEKTNLLSQKGALVAQLQNQLVSRRASITWAGAFSGNWSLIQNWTPAGPPTGADIVFSNSAGANLSQILSTNFAINSVVFDSTLTNSVVLSGTNGAQLSIANGIDMSEARADLIIQIPLALSQSQVWSIGAGRWLSLNNPLSLGSCNLLIAGEGVTCFSNVISGSGSLRIRSSGTTVLAGTNSFTGGIELSGGGFAVARNNSALGSGVLSIPNQSTLAIAPGVILSNPAEIQGSGVEVSGVGYGAITVWNSGTGTYNGPVTVIADTGLRAGVSGSVLALGGPVTGTASLKILAGAGIVRFTTNQFYSGKTLVEGRLQLAGGADTLPAGNEVILANSDSAGLELGDNDQTLASISGGGWQGGNTALGRGTLTIRGAGSAIYNGAICGIGNLQKQGPGTLILAGTNSYTGTSRILQGVLEVSGTLQSSTVFVDGGTLTGSGSIQGPVTVLSTGSLQLRAASGPLTVHNQLRLAPGSTTFIELDPAQSKSGVIQGLTSATYGGLLLVSNIAPSTPFINGQTFRLFSSTAAQGTFSQIQPDPGPGLAWQFDPARGLLTAVARPALQIVSAGPKLLQLSWPNQGFHLQVMTNSMGLGTNNAWLDYPGGGTMPVMIPIDPQQPAMFFRLVGF